MSSENVLLDAPVQEPLETTLLGKKDEAVSGEFDTLVNQGNTFLNDGAYQKAAECFEKARKCDVVREKEVLESLAKAYRGCQDEIRAIYWFECAAEEGGRENYEHDIMELYRTGVVGSELKEEAEEYFTTLAKAEEERKKAARKEELKSYFGPEKIDYPQSFIDKMYELIEFERTYNYKLNNTKQEEKEKVRESLEGKYQTLLQECKEEKEKCHADQDFFFEYPMSRETRYYAVANHRKKDGHSLYAFGSDNAQPFYLHEQGYDVIYDSSLHAARIGERYVHVPDTYVAGELDFFFFDEKNKKGQLKDKEADVSEADLYTNWDYRRNLVSSLDSLKSDLVDDERFITLYCDWDYMKAHTEEKYEWAYLWDTDLLLVRRYTDYRDKFESLQAYHDAAKDLTEIYLPVGEGRTFQDMKEYVLAWGYAAHGDWEDDQDLDMRYMKKAILIQHNERIVAIILPKKPADVIKVHASRCTVTDENYQIKHFNKVESIRRETGANWKFYVATTMDYIAFKLGDQLKPIDITERKPEGLPEDLWRLWIRFRYAYQVETKS